MHGPLRRMRRPLLFSIFGAPVLILLVHWVRVWSVSLPVAEAIPVAGLYTGQVLAGALHVHTTESDGRADVDTVARAAAAAGLDFLMLTDHNIEPPDPERRHGVLLVPGVELSTSAGHVLAVGATRLPSWGRRLDDPVASGRFAGGVVILAHPVNRKHPWTGEWDTADAMEVVSGDSLIREALARPFSRLLPAVAAMPISPTVASLSIKHRPDEAFDTWDAHPELMGVCAHDAHGYEGYAGPFEAMQLRLRIDDALPDDPVAASEAVVSALAAGGSWCTLGTLLDPAGFVFEAIADAGADAEGPAVVASLRYERWPDRVRSRIVLFRDGEAVAEGDLEASIAPAPPGRYRAEVHLDVPWIWGRRTFLWIFTDTLKVGPPVPG